MTGELGQIIRALTSPEAYPHEVSAVEVIQTHVSYVLLAGEYAYKIKKPLSLGFLDYGTLELRRRMCEEEVRLNRRLCDGVYLGVVPVTRRGPAYRMGGDGEAVEYAVHMRRVPRERMLDQLIAHGAPIANAVRRVAREIASFHQRAQTDDHIASYGRPAVLRMNCEENFQQLSPFGGSLIRAQDVDALRQYVQRSLDRDGALFEQRAEGGRVRDNHGDLRSDAVYVSADGGVCIMDCIEFSERIRFGDVAGDIGFLAMDLEFRNRRELSDELMATYLTAAPDETLPVVLPFYKTYRAVVRAKVEAMRSAESEVPEEARTASREAAREYIELALRYASRSYPPCLIYMVGLSGTGKSFIANAIACRTGAAVLGSDVLRERGGVPAEDRYTLEQRDRVYDEMRRRAAEHLALGRPVILDATHIARRHREAARQLAARFGAPAFAVEVVATEALVRSRLAERVSEGVSVSDATWRVYQEQQREAEPIGPDEANVIRLPAETGLTPAVDAVLAAIGA